MWAKHHPYKGTSKLKFMNFYLFFCFLGFSPNVFCCNFKGCYKYKGKVNYVSEGEFDDGECSEFMKCVCG